MMQKTTINRTTKFMLILFGIWPGISYITLCRIFWAVTIVIVLLCHYLYFLKHYHSVDIFDLMDCFSSFMGFLKLMINVIFFWLNQRIFNETLTMMTEDWNDCAKSNIEMQKAINKEKTSNRIANTIMTFHTVAPFLYSIGIILANVDVTDPTIQLPHIYKVEVPFSINTQRTYRAVLIVELIHLIMCSWGLGNLNALLVTLILHIGGQINILHCWLIELVFKKNKLESIAITIEKIIRKHQKIIYFAKNIENLYTYIAFMQFVSNTIMICLIGFLIITAFGDSNATEKIVKAVSYYSVTNIEAFIFCYAGEYLINKSKTIGLAAYNIAWYELEPEYSRILLFIIMRTQKQLTLTVGKMTDLSLQCFASIMNSAGSYLSVLLALQ
ncbi:odorant receptor 13a-like [Cataglyphis hispanica]|uniref:odorant receptor 13a-like n=1 Tax=Cataglyphis hispanica TaxID=1086592 RepID=UPI00218094F7|nr:odorant receptor 13a-like [Cataglyphis hispanica]